MISSSVSEFRRVFSPGPDEVGRRLTYSTAFRRALTIHRPAVMPLSIGLAVAMVPVCAHSWAEMRSIRTFVAGVMLIAYVLLTNVVNCLADRWLDAGFKTRLATAVAELGVRRVRRIILSWLALIGTLSIWLTVMTGHAYLLLLIGVAVVLAFQYSLPPLHLKGAGIWQIPTVAVMVAGVPGIVLLSIYDRPFDWTALLILTGVALVINGPFIVNAAEDMPEDAVHSVMTAPRALGLPRALSIGLAQILGGAVIFFGATFPIIGFSWTYIPYLAAVAVGAGYLARLIVAVLGKTEAEAVAALRAERSFALIAMLLAWGMVAPAVAVFVDR